MFVISVNANSLYRGLQLFKLLDFLLTSFGLPKNILWCDWAEFIQCVKVFSVFSFSWLSLLSSPRHLTDGLLISDRSISLNCEQSCALWEDCSVWRLSAHSFCSVSVQETLASLAHFILIEHKLKASKLHTNPRQWTQCSSVLFSWR